MARVGFSQKTRITSLAQGIEILRGVTVLALFGLSKSMNQEKYK